MKILYTLFLCYLINISSALAQFTSGGSGQISNNDDVFDNDFYVRIGLALPMGDHYSEVNSDAGTNLTDGIGAAADIGSIYYLNKIQLSERMKLGICITWLNFTLNSLSDTYNDGAGYHFQALHKFGPIFSYNFADKFIVDVSPKLALRAGIATVDYSDYSSGYYDSYTVSGSGLALGYSMEFNLRYKRFMTGLVFNLGSTNYNITYAGDDYGKYNIGNSTFSLMTGFSF